MDINSNRCVPSVFPYASEVNATPEPVEVLMLLLPDAGRADNGNFRQWATKAGLVHHVRGNGIDPFPLDALCTPLPGGLKRDAHIFVIGHGTDKITGSHTQTLCQRSKLIIHSKELMAFMHDLTQAQQAPADQAHATPTLNFHFFSCGVGVLREEIAPDSALWRNSVFYLYASKKGLCTSDALESIKTTLEYLSDCKYRSRQVMPLKLFEITASQRIQCMSIGGGTLSAPVIAHSPRIPTDIARPLFGPQARCMKGPLPALQTLATFESERMHPRLTSPQEKARQEQNHMERVLKRAIYHNDLPRLKGLLESQPDLINFMTEDGSNLISVATSEGHIDIVRYLLSVHDNPNHSDIYGNTPLHIAATKDDVTLINFLLSQGANLEAKTMSGKTPLQQAFQMGAFRAMITLLNAGARYADGRLAAPASNSAANTAANSPNQANQPGD